MLGHVTTRSSSVAVLFISITEAPFRALEMGENSAELKSIIGMVGKSNSIRKLSCDSWFQIFEPSIVCIFATFLAVNVPDFVTNSMTSQFNKLEVKSVCAAASVAWPHILTCKRPGINYSFDQQFNAKRLTSK